MMHKIIRKTQSRRSFLFFLLTLFAKPGRILAQMSECHSLCGDVCNLIPNPIALVLDMSGPLSMAGKEYVKGAELAVKGINNSGGKVSLKIYDSMYKPNRVLSLIEYSINEDRAKVVIGLLGSHLIQQVAKEYRNVAFFNIGRSTTQSSDYRNSFLLPFDNFQRLGKSANNQSKSRCPVSSYAWQMYTAIQLLEIAVRKTRDDNIVKVIKSLRSMQFTTSFGIFRNKSGTFLLQ